MSSRSHELCQRAQRVIPGGVNSPVRAFRSVNGNPVFIAAGHGAHVYDVDGRDYVDYVQSWGPLILGHAPVELIAALQTALLKGTSFGMSTEAEVELAERVIEAFPSIEKVRLVNSGTEAAMSALRLARGVTGRSKIAKFAGCYHGHADGLLVKAGSGAMTFGTPDSAGVPSSYASETLILPYNDSETAASLLRSNGEDLAAVIVEPVAGNMGCIPPREGFLESLRTVCTELDALLIFDEVITGFRVAYGGMQALTGIQPDLTILGKVLGGGLPIGAYGGKKDVMDQLAPEGPVYQAGTLSGNPLAVQAGLATLGALSHPGAYEKLESLGDRLEKGIAEQAKARSVPIQINRLRSMLTLFFNEGEVFDHDSASLSDTRLFASFHKNMLECGVFLPPSQFECWFLGLAHGEGEIELTCQAVGKALDALIP